MVLRGPGSAILRDRSLPQRKVLLPPRSHGSGQRRPTSGACSPPVLRDRGPPRMQSRLHGPARPWSSTAQDPPPPAIVPRRRGIRLHFRSRASADPVRSSRGGGRHGPTSGAGPNLWSQADAAQAPRSCATVVLRGARSSSPCGCPAAAGESPGSVSQSASAPAPPPEPGGHGHESGSAHSPGPRPFTDHGHSHGHGPSAILRGHGPAFRFVCHPVSRTSPRSSSTRGCPAPGSKILCPRSWASAVRCPPPPAVVPRRRNPVCAILRGRGPLRREVFLRLRLFHGGKIPHPWSCAATVLRGFQPLPHPSLVPIPILTIRSCFARTTNDNQRTNHAPTLVFLSTRSYRARSLGSVAPTYGSFKCFRARRWVNQTDPF